MVRHLGRFLVLLPLFLSLACSGKREEDLDLGPVGSFSLQERDSSTITQDDLRGKVWVASFIFTRCTGPCPQVTGTVARLQQELNLENEADLRLITFTVDPERDNPGELKEYATRYSADPKKWLFLTGKKKELHELLIKQFKVAVAEKPDEEKKPGDEFAHSTRLVVIDRRGHIRGFFDGLPASPREEDTQAFEGNLKKLKSRVATLLREKS